jgi:GxxExxY protein
LIGVALKVHTAPDVHLPVVYESGQLATAFRVDFIVEKCVIVDIKSVEHVLPVHRAQLLSCLRLTGLPLGLLINFNIPHLKHRIYRMINAPEQDL